MNKQKNKGLNRYWIYLATLLSFSACKKEVSESLPGNTPDVAFNFYIASDAMDAAYAPLKSTVAVYVDEYQEQTAPFNAGSGNKFPTISFGFKGSHEYPSSNNGGINYLRFAVGDHRLLFTDVNNTIVLDTTINTLAKSFNNFYLADLMTAPTAPVAYKLVTTEEDRKAMDGKTGVRFINLSPDAGNITYAQQKANGEVSGSQTGEIAFGGASDYQFFGPEAIASDGLIRFTLSNESNGVKFDTGIPFDPGRNYVVLISGFRTDQQREMATGKNPDGSIKKEIITIGSNLRAEIRTSY